MGREDCNDRCYGEPCVHHKEYTEMGWAKPFDWSFIEDRDADLDGLAFPNYRTEPITVDVQLLNPDPEVLKLLGFSDDREPAPHSLEVFNKRPVKRTWWQWLLRRPVKYIETLTYFPSVRFVSGNETGEENG